MRGSLQRASNTARGSCRAPSQTHCGRQTPWRSKLYGNLPVKLSLVFLNVLCAAFKAGLTQALHSDSSRVLPPSWHWRR